MSLKIYSSLTAIYPLALTGVPIRMANWDAATLGDTWPWLVISGVSSSVFTSAAHGQPEGQPIIMESTVELPDPIAHTGLYYLRDVTTNTFKLAETPGGVALTIASAGSGVIRFRKKKVRTWLVYHSRFWWVMDELGNSHPAKASDLTAAEAGAQNWTYLDEACFGPALQTQLRAPARRIDHSCALPQIQNATVPPEDLDIPATAKVSKIPPPAVVELGGGAGTGGKAGGGSGGGSGGKPGGGSSGGSAGGTGSGSSTSSGALGGGAGGGSAGGSGGGSGGAADGGQPQENQPQPEDPNAPDKKPKSPPWLPSVLLSAASYGEVGIPGSNRYMFSVNATLDSAPADDAASAAELFSVRLAANNQVRWIGFLPAGGAAASPLFEIGISPAASGNRGGTLTLVCTVSGRGVSATTRRTYVNSGPWPWADA